MAAIEVRGIEVNYELSGDGTAGDGTAGDGTAGDGTAGRSLPVIWGHGLTSSIANEDELGLIDWWAVRAHASVLRYDARGHGLSSSTADPQDYHWRNLALDQLALADALGIGSYVGAGASMGAATALHAAVLAPERIAGLLLVIPPTAWETRAAQQANYEVTAKLIDAGEIDLLVNGMKSMPPPDPFAGNPLWGDGSEATVRNTDPVRLARIFRGAAVADFPSPAEIAGISVPVRILAWTGDAGHPVSTAARLRELIPHAEVVTVSTPAQLLRWTSRAIEFIDSI